MTTEKLAIRSLLTNDATYLELLGNPGSAPYKTYYIYPPTTPDFPYVVFILRPADVNTGIDRNLISRRYDLLFYVFSQNGIYETIAARIVYLLHQIGNSNGFRTIFFGEINEEYKPELNAYSIEIKFNLFSRKELI